MSPHQRASSGQAKFSNTPFVRRIPDRSSSGEYNSMSNHAASYEPATQRTLRPAQKSISESLDVNRSVRHEPEMKPVPLNPLLGTDLPTMDDKKVHLKSPISKVQVTMTQLYAYAEMRGLRGRVGEDGGPLWDSLYEENVTDSSSSAESPILVNSELPERSRLNCKASSTTLHHLSKVASFKIPKGKRFVFDLSQSSTQLPRKTEQPYSHTDIMAEARRLKHQPPSEALHSLYSQGLPLPTFKPNHYRGDEGYANYGYLMLNGAWVDPDSLGEVANALHGVSGAPAPEAPISSSGPRVLTEEELNEVYDALNDYVSDDEGDPRDRHVTPEAFATWAKGAGEGPSYVRETLPPQASQRKRDNNERPITPQLRLRPQIDLETGSDMTGICDADQDERIRPLWSPRGVDPVMMPALAFSQHNPQANAQLMRRAYFPEAAQAPPYFYGDAETVQEFTSQLGQKVFQTGEDPQTGVDGYRQFKEQIGRILDKREISIDKYLAQCQRLEDAQARKLQLVKEVAFLKQHAELVKRAAQYGKYQAEVAKEEARRAQIQKEEEARKISLAEEEAKQMQVQRHERHLWEVSERFTTDQRWAEGMGVRAREEALNEEEEMKELEQEKAELMQDIGITDLRQIPNLIPPPQVKTPRPL